MFVENAEKMLESGTLHPQTSIVLNGHVALIKKGEIEYKNIYTVEQFLEDFRNGLIY